MTTPPWLQFFERNYPSANMVLIRGPQPILIDPGFGSELAATERLLREAGTPPEELQLIVNTHYHGDHVGGNHGLQTRYHLPIAAHHREAILINCRDAQACCCDWLNQPIEAYTVNRMLSEGDALSTGEVTLETLHTPGHTEGHLSLYEPDEQVLICGDVVHSNDVAWINLFREGPGALKREMETLQRLLRLPLRQAYSGHGPAIEQPHNAIEIALKRYEKWLADPEKLGWHAIKRIFTYALMIYNHIPMDEAGLTAYLLEQRWFQDYAQGIFRSEPVDFVKPLLTEIQRSGAAEWQHGRLVAQAPYNPVPDNWTNEPIHPRDWPKI